ncbi:MAG: hypothetical protein U0L43_09840 [Muribaculaceae bacterium]|nr:hypothetical protein [Muribaculaceae bacterium]
MNLNVKDYAEYEANVEVFAALEKAGVNYESNVSDVLYEHIYDEIFDILIKLRTANLSRIIQRWANDGNPEYNLTDIVRSYGEMYCDNLIGEKITRVFLLRWIIVDFNA